jgi:hypothetical protein
MGPTAERGGGVSSGRAFRTRLLVASACLAVATAATACGAAATQADPTGTVWPAGTSAATSTSAPGSVARALAALAVKGRAPKTGYDRSNFGQAWTDDVSVPGGHNGCDTRNDVLRRDLTAVAIRPGTHGCLVVSGSLDDPYSGRRIPFLRGESTSVHVQIDHVVALSNAWQTGGAQLTADSRQDLANDPLNLWAVDGSENESKGDGDAATWLPPNKQLRCLYVARQVAVKTAYRLWVTPAEDAAIARVLRSCPDERLPTEAQWATPAVGRTGR